MGFPAPAAAWPLLAEPYFSNPYPSFPFVKKSANSLIYQNMVRSGGMAAGRDKRWRQASVGSDRVLKRAILWVERDGDSSYVLSRFPEHDPEKWKPVFRKDHAQSKS
jgi:hypothetical protein